MERVLGTNFVSLPDGEAVQLEYFVLEENAGKEQHAREKRLTVYGIGIRKLQAGKQETELVNGVTESEEKAYKWASRLMRNQVMPICLAETLDDFITEEGV